MRCIIVGSNHQAAIEHCYAKHLSRFGTSVSIFPIQQFFLAYYQRSLFNKVLFRVGLSNIFRQINRQLKVVIEQEKPVWVWVFKGMEVLPETIVWLKNRDIKVINFNPDNPFIFSGRGSGNRNVTDSISLFDYYFSYDNQVVQQLREKKVNAGLLPFGHDVEDKLYNEVIQTTSEKVKTCFLGMPDKYRAAFLQQLADAGMEIDCYGIGWSLWIQHSRVQCHPGQYGLDFWRTLYQYRVQLNYMRVHNPHSHNMRTFEIPAIGGIQLAPRTKDHADFFCDGQEIFLYDNAENCIEKIRQLLEMDSAKSKSIRNNARKRCIDSGYSYSHRTQQVLKVVEQLLQ